MRSKEEEMVGERMKTNKKMNKKMKLKETKISLLLLLTMVGCAGSYTCKEYPSGKCQSVSNVYDKTNKPSLPESFPDSPRKPFNHSESGVMSTTLLGAPILKEPKVLRVLMNYWVDEDQDLNLGGYLFLKLGEAEWHIH
jgi:hypothetical protein